MRIAHFRLPIADCNSRAGNHRKSTRSRPGSLRSAQWAALLFLLAFLPQTVAGPSAEAASAAIVSLNDRSVVEVVDVVGITVGDMDRSIDFFSNVLLSKRYRMSKSLARTMNACKDFLDCECEWCA
jgi:hypothetical protein